MKFVKSTLSELIGFIPVSILCKRPNVDLRRMLAGYIHWYLVVLLS